MDNQERRQKRAQYVKAYEWSNIWAMIQNNKRMPEIHEDDFRGKQVIITGATSGIGLITAHKYAAMGANLILINRNQEKSDSLCSDLNEKYAIECSCYIADLSSLAEVHSVAQSLSELPHDIDLIIHNAGVFLTEKELTCDGIEKVWMVHYLSSFIINYKLKEKLMSQKEARILMVNSEGHRFAVWGIRTDDINWDQRKYSGYGSYGAAKTAQLLSMLIFKEVFGESGVTINAMHPGAVTSNSGQENGMMYKWWKQHVLDKLLKKPEVSAEALYFLGASATMSQYSGKFFNLTTLEEPTPPALDLDVARELWSLSLAMANM